MQGQSLVKFYAMGDKLWPWTLQNTTDFLEGMTKYFADVPSVGNFSLVGVQRIPPDQAPVR